MSKKHYVKSKKLEAIAAEAGKTYNEIVEAAERMEEEKTPDYVELVERIVTKLENKNKIDILAYDTLTKKYPQIKDTLNQLIAELRVFSIYDAEPSTVNFDYSAYLKQIEALAVIS